MKKFIAISALAAVMMVSPAFAEGDGPGDGKMPHKGGHGAKFMERMFDKNDLDGDGALSKEEFDQAGENRFKEMDADGDGKITKDEAKEHFKNKRAKMQEMQEMKREGFGQGAASDEAEGGAAPVESEGAE